MNKSFSKEREKCGKPSESFASCSASSDLFLCKHHKLSLIYIHLFILDR